MRKASAAMPHAGSGVSNSMSGRSGSTGSPSGPPCSTAAAPDWRSSIETRKPAASPSTRTQILQKQRTLDRDCVRRPAGLVLLRLVGCPLLQQLRALRNWATPRARRVGTARAAAGRQRKTRWRSRTAQPHGAAARQPPGGIGGSAPGRGPGVRCPPHSGQPVGRHARGLSPR